jgi:hypothetical protein
VFVPGRKLIPASPVATWRLKFNLFTVIFRAGSMIADMNCACRATGRRNRLSWMGSAWISSAKQESPAGGTKE